MCPHRRWTIPDDPIGSSYPVRVGLARSGGHFRSVKERSDSLNSPNSGGMMPFSWLKLRSRNRKLLSVFNSGGMPPVNSIGILPFKWFSGRFISDTAPALQLTPNHKQCESVDIQPAVSVHWAPSAARKSVVRAWHSSWWVYVSNPEDVGVTEVMLD